MNKNRAAIDKEEKEEVSKLERKEKALEEKLEKANKAIAKARK